MNLEGKVALVTGGGIRVGKGIALELARAGCDVFVHYGRSEQPARNTQQAVQALGRRSEIFSANLAQVEAVEKVVPTAVEAFGQVDILVNNAAIFPEEDSFSDSDAAAWDKIMHINARAPYLLSRAFARQLPDESSGVIININDARIPHPATDHFVYRLAKRALWDMTQLMALELAPDVRVNAVALGAILPPPGKPQAYLDDVAAKRIPLKRPGSVEFVAQNVLHLITQPFLTGVTIEIDGGEFIG